MAHTNHSSRVMQGDDSNAGSADGTLGRIALKQVRMSRAEVEARNREASQAHTAAARKGTNPMNRLVPYLDLFSRLSDDELSRLARAPVNAVESLRQQVEEVNRALGRYLDLLPRLTDDELARLTGATSKTIRFWRLSQPRHLQGEIRRSNPDLTPPPQSLAHREPSSAHREPSSAHSSATMVRRDEEAPDSLSQPFRASEQTSETSETSELGAPDDELDPSESATFVIDTVEC